jgi:hypothetical protein
MIWYLISLSLVSTHMIQYRISKHMIQYRISKHMIQYRISKHMIQYRISKHMIQYREYHIFPFHQLKSGRLHDSK